MQTPSFSLSSKRKSKTRKSIVQAEEWAAPHLLRQDPGVREEGELCWVAVGVAVGGVTSLSTCVP